VLPGAGPEVRALLLVALLAGTAAADRAVTVYGTVLKGTIGVDGDELVVTRGKREKRYPRGDFLLAEDDAGKVVYAPGFEERMRGYVHLARLERRDRLEDLLGDALSARDSKLARAILEQAEADGFTGKKADQLKRKVESLEKRAPSIDLAKSTRTREALAAAQLTLADLLLARARLGDGDSDRLLREALRVAPDHAGALALLAERAPKDFPAGDARFWLDFHLDLEAHGVTLVGDDDLELKRARATWRKDLYGLRSGPLCLLTPVHDSRTTGRCLAYGALVCEALGSLFATDAPKLRSSKALLLLLYENKEEYVLKSGADRRPEERAFLEMTAGHYSPLEQLSRLFWEKDPDAERRVARVFAHELTHHWVMQLNPRYADSELSPGSDPSGYWVVEGLATFLEEGSYDIEDGTWNLFDGRAHSLDMVQAVAKQKRLLPWKDLYVLNQRSFQQLRAIPDVIPVNCRWHLGPAGTTASRLFYDQAGATVQYLYHGKGGRYRAKLARYVTSYYTADKDGLNIENAFGLTPHELGLEVEEFARQVAAGWRPATEEHPTKVK